MKATEEIKARLDIVELVSDAVQLRKSGKNYTGFCPFHQNTRTPSFVVWPETGTWRCFGQCNEGGDIFKYVMKKEGWDFPETLRHLADRAGVELRKPTPQEEAQQEEHERLRRLLDDAVVFYRQQLSSEQGQYAHNYLKERGLSEATLAIFDLGYAPDSWDAGMNYFLEKGYSVEEMLEAGMIIENDKGRRYDRFRHRVMFPIRDERGRMTGFGARALKADEPAKYLNSPQTPLFDKSSVLYGLNLARKEIRAKDEVVIVEGYMDVIGLHQADFRNVVAQMGTALTEPQLRKLKRLTRRMVLALDSDAAGMNATLRGLQVARETLDRESEMRYDPRGLLRNEARLKADIRVTSLPEGTDPDEIVKDSPEAWAEIVAASKPVVVHVMETLAEGRDLEDPKVKTEIAEQVLPLISDLPNPIERDTFIQQLARLLKLDERTLIASRPRPSRRGQQRKRRYSTPPPPEPQEIPQQVESKVKSSTHILEEHCLGIVMRHPELLYRVDRILQEAGLERLSSRDFQHTDHQEMFRVALEAIDQDYLEPLNFALENLPLPLGETVDEILVQTEELDPNEERVLEDLLRTILHMRKTSLRQNNDQLRFLQAEAQEGGDLKASQYQQTMVSNINTLQQLDRAMGKFTERSAISG
ncbi:MAG: DNA primase [Chloroflexi bacterium]|nr:MAG: DNA primase [Chloroflexota bacterium]MBL1196267.1 DNA primase [Chloroflexota bacterium]NOH13562.1 DNA primase [Chloroflexota bacterium]